MKDLFRQLNWPQVVALCAIIGGTVGFVVLAPPHTLEIIGAWNWMAIASATTAVISALGAAFGGPLKRQSTPPPTSSAMPSLPPLPPSLSPPPLPLPDSDATPRESPRAKSMRPPGREEG